MKAKIFGMQKVDFVSGESEHIKGLKLHFFREALTDNERAAWSGMVYDKQWIAADSELLLFGIPARQFFDAYDAKKNMVKYPIDAEVKFEMLGRKSVFTGVEIIK